MYQINTKHDLNYDLKVQFINSSNINDKLFYVLQKEWFYECIYNNKIVKIDNFIIKIEENKIEDKLENKSAEDELEDLLDSL